jgi:hypothetical protein
MRSGYRNKPIPVRVKTTPINPAILLLSAGKSPALSLPPKAKNMNNNPATTRIVGTGVLCSASI